jgi:hypothetical protein
MYKSWLVTIAVATTAALFMAPSTPPQRPVPQRMANAYADWLVPYIGKDFYLSADWTVATEKKRTSSVPVDAAGEFTLAAVGQDFVYFESRSDRVCVSLVALRAVLDK